MQQNILKRIVQINKRPFISLSHI